MPFRRVLRRVAVAAVALAVAATLAYRLASGSWWAGPERIAHCGRTYLPAAGGLSLDDVRQRTHQTALPGDAPYPLQTVGRVPPIVGGELLAAVTPEGLRRELAVPCAMVVYLQTGEHTYREYVISGGP